MTATTPTRRPRVAPRRTGYVVAGVLNAGLIYLINVQPGWQVVPLFTEDTHQVLGLVNLSLLAGVVVNAVYSIYDAPWWKLLGDLATTGIGLAALVRIWQVFPFDFRGASVNWPLLMRVVLVVALVGAALGVIAQVISLVRAVFPRQR